MQMLTRAYKIWMGEAVVVEILDQEKYLIRMDDDPVAQLLQDIHDRLPEHVEKRMWTYGSEPVRLLLSLYRRLLGVQLGSGSNPEEVPPVATQGSERDDNSTEYRGSGTRGLDRDVESGIKL